MFLDKWIPKKYLVKSEICSLEISVQENGTTYYFTHLKNKGKSLSIEESGVIEDLKDLPKRILKNKVPLLLIVNGKGIIIKKVSLSEEGNQNIKEIIKQNLPTINPEEFYVQVFRQNNSSAFISLCRKEQVNVIIDELKKNKYDIAEVFIGAPSIMGLEPLWNNFNQIQTTSHGIELTNGVIESIQPTSNGNTKISIGDLQIDQNHILGFSGGLSYLMQNKIAENANEELKTLNLKHFEKNKFRILTLTSVAIAFVLAITNVMFYSTYFTQNNKLETQLSVYQGKYDQINKLLSDYQSKKGLIENAGILNKNKLSEFADRIGATIPEEVVLSHMYFNPKKEDIESEDSLVTFQSKHLVIRGNCNKSLVVNEWINVLKMQKFVKDVSLEKFTYNKEAVLPNFEIRIITE